MDGGGVQQCIQVRRAWLYSRWELDAMTRGSKLREKWEKPVEKNMIGLDQLHADDQLTD